VCIVAGVVLLAVFYAVERRTDSPLINVRIFANRAFAVENVVLGIAMMAFIPVFFFVSLYGQIALVEKATTASLLILYFFLGFVVFAQIGGRMLDRIGAKRPVVLGCALAAVGFALWAGKATDLPGPAASAEAAKIAQQQGGNGNVTTIPPFIRADFAGATRDVLYVMAVIMAVAGVVALRGLRRGVQQETEETAAELAAQSRAGNVQAGT